MYLPDLFAIYGPQPSDTRSPEAVEWLRQVEEAANDPATWEEGEPLEDRLRRWTAEARA